MWISSSTFPVLFYSADMCLVLAEAMVNGNGKPEMKF
jgi:hypothetical protein